MKILALLFFLVAINSAAQEKLRTVAVSDTILFPAIDRTGDFYVVTKAGQVQRFNPDGKLTLLYKAAVPPTLFDPRDGARLFAYYRNDQHYEYLSPSFVTTASYQIDPSLAIEPWLICPSGDHKLWILDQADHSLKKINVRAAEVEVEVLVDSTLVGSADSFTVMREYQNFVFLLNPSKGIYIFNGLGNHIRTLESQGIETFNFLGEELYYLRTGEIEFFNLFTAESRRLPVDSHYDGALVTDERLILFTPETIDIFLFRP